MTWTGEQQFRLLVLSPGSVEAVTYKLAKDGSFNWGLMPGDYAIVGYVLNKGTETRSGRIWARFTVPQNVKSLYIGDLKLLMEKGLYRVGIKDDQVAAIERYRNRFLEAHDLPQKGLMEPEMTVGSYDRMNYICAEGWGIECTSSNRGVTPSNPETVTKGFSVVDSLTPTLEWKPSAKEDVSYDLVIYEAISYSISGIDTQYMPGGVVVYEEGLKVPKWQPDTPFKPNQKYYWSVRLRRDGVVSNWSTSSHFAFYLVAWSSGYGQLFSFTTPAK